ncbi:hypothetical protein ACMT1E_13450 [Sphingomonas flavalba]|uniref:hypothetical protein n=1 Tax=Sphingomonas flavalba TaxID=2559804 RepID=UPI0039E0BFBB
MLAWWVDALAGRLTPKGERKPEVVELAPADVHVMTAPLPPGGRVAAIVAAMAPIPPEQLRWTAHVTTGAGGRRQVRVAMARKAAIAAARRKAPLIGGPTVIARDGHERFVLVEGGSGSTPAARRTVIALLAALGLILTIPLTTAFVAGVLAASERRAIAAVDNGAAQRAEVQRALAERLRPALARPPLSALAADAIRAMPAGAAIHAIRRDDSGLVTIEIDAADPDRVSLPGFRRTGQWPVTDRGIRSRFEARP